MARRTKTDGSCRFNCRTEKQAFIEGYNWARKPAIWGLYTTAEAEYKQWIKHRGQKEREDTLTTN